MKIKDSVIKAIPVGKQRRTASIALLVIISIAAVIALNIIIGHLSPNITDLDMRKLSEISDTTEEYIKELDTDVELMLISDSDEVDKRILNFVHKYTALSDHLSFSVHNSVKEPMLILNYGTETNSLIVNCPATGKFSSVAFTGYADSLIVYAYTVNQFTGAVSSYESAFDAETQITRAIDYVTHEASNTVYLLKGHGEAELQSEAASALEKANIIISKTPVNLVDGGSIPDDCELLLCNNPGADLSEEEVGILSSYMQSGGNVMITTNYYDLVNFNKLFREYGFEMQTGVVGDQARFYEAYYNMYGYSCIVPILSESLGVEGEAVTISSSGMLFTDPSRSAITDTVLMSTSEYGMLYSDSGEPGSEFNEYIIGAAATEPVTVTDTDGNTSTIDSRLTVVTSGYIFSDNINQAFTDAANLRLLTSLVNANFKNVSNIKVPSKNISINYNRIRSNFVWGILFIAIIPLGCIAGGLIYWNKRRKH